MQTITFNSAECLKKGCAAQPGPSNIPLANPPERFCSWCLQDLSTKIRHERVDF